MKKMRKDTRYLLFIAWISYLLTSSLFLFMDGFFLNRVARSDVSECELCDSEDDCRSEQLFRDVRASTSICPRPRSRVILLIVDALKYEFVEWHENADARSTPALNKIPTMRRLRLSEPDNTRILKLVADPPTTTMQRLKALTTGTLPTFIDARANFAAESIGEDNIIDQASKRGGIVFMGDDTWTKLFPGKFLREYPSPSFDVRDLDTADRQVRRAMSEEIKKDDWNLLVAHTLGVDHCGHRYGPRHPEMARKLGDVDRLVREIVDALDADTTLFVVGDHGMTDDGDHGGDSASEVEAAMFVYSKNRLVARGARRAARTLAQIDLVPTLSAILGIPIPFSNIGALISECLPGAVGDNGRKEDDRFVAASLWRNVAQTAKYVRAYTRDSILFTDGRIEELDRLLNDAERRARTIDGDDEDRESLERFVESSERYLKRVRDSCAEVWIQFDAGSMSKGLIIFFSVLFLVHIPLSAVRERRMNEIVETNFLFVVVATNICAICASCVLRWLEWTNDLRNSTFFATGAVSVLSLAILVVENWDVISSAWYRGATANKINYAERAIFLLGFCAVFSNSFIIEEDKVTLFLLVTTIALLAYRILDDKNDKNDKNDKKEKKPATARYVRCVSIVVGFVGCLAARFSRCFWRCREEQDQRGCSFLGGKGPFAEDASANGALLVASVTVLAIYVTLIGNWLRGCERLSLFLRPGRNNIARHCYGVVAVGIGCYWAFERLPALALVKQINAPLPTVVYSFVVAGMCALYYRPLGLFVTAGDVGEIGEIGNGGPIVLYSSAFISLSCYLTLVCALVLGYFFALGILAMFVSCTAVLAIVAMERFASANSVAELSQAPISAILCWFLIAEYFFYGTGHQSTFPTIHWDAAFVGTDGPLFYGHYLPMILIGFNTFGCHIVAAMTLPLLAIVPFTIYAMVPAMAKPKFNVNADDMRKGELVLFERNATFHHALFSIYGKYILFHGLRTFGCMLSATIHCRHLMAWKIFAPKLIFQGSSLLVSLASVLASAFMIRRVDAQLENLQLRRMAKTR